MERSSPFYSSSAYALTVPFFSQSNFLSAPQPWNSQRYYLLGTSWAHAVFAAILTLFLILSISKNNAKSNTYDTYAMEINFVRHGHGCPLLLTRPLPASPSISLVKSAFSLSRKTKFYAGRAGRPLHRPTKLITVKPFGCPVMESVYFEFCLRQKIRIRC